MTRSSTPSPVSSPVAIAAAGAVRGALSLTLGAALVIALLAAGSATGDDTFAKAPGVDEVWLVQEEGAFDREAATARHGLVRVTIENRMERPARVSVIDAATRKILADFAVGIRQVNWEEVPLVPGDYEIVAQRIGEGSPSRSRLTVRGERSPLTPR